MKRRFKQDNRFDTFIRNFDINIIAGDKLEIPVVKVPNLFYRPVIQDIKDKKRLRV